MTLLLIASLLAAPADPPPADTTWYGWQTLLTDVASVGLATLTSAHGSPDTESTVLGLSSAAFYFLGGPAVHLLHGRGGTALLDFGLRVGIPAGAGLLGAALASGLSNGSSSDCPACVTIAGFLFGATLGGVAASVVDVGWLAQEPAPARPIVPAVSWMRGRDGARHPAFGLAAAF